MVRNDHQFFNFNLHGSPNMGCCMARVEIHGCSAFCIQVPDTFQAECGNAWFPGKHNRIWRKKHVVRLKIGCISQLSWFNQSFYETGIPSSGLGKTTQSCLINLFSLCRDKQPIWPWKDITPLQQIQGFFWGPYMDWAWMTSCFMRIWHLTIL